MKILHCADIHLDSAMTANLDKDKARERRNELLASFKDMVGYAVKERIGVIIIAGDLFDTRNISVGVACARFLSGFCVQLEQRRKYII